PRTRPLAIDERPRGSKFRAGKLNACKAALPALALCRPVHSGGGINPSLVFGVLVVAACARAQSCAGTKSVQSREFPKMVLPHKGVAFVVKDVFTKKFFGAGRDSAGGALASVLRKHSTEGRIHDAAERCIRHCAGSRSPKG